MEKLHGCWRRDREDAVGTTDSPGTYVDWRAPCLIHIELVECGRSRNYIDDAVEGANLVKMDLFQGCAVDLGLGHRYKLEDGYSVINNRLGKTALADNAANIPKAPMVFFALVFLVTVITTIFMPLDVEMLPVTMPYLGRG